MKKYVLVGAGGRSPMFTDALSKDFKDSGKLLAICDNNEGRLKRAHILLKNLIPDIQAFEAKDFDKMISNCRPDIVIVTARDSAHDEYICRALNLGCDVITEKPMTIEEDRCQQIIDTVNKTDRKVIVTFNYRYSPPRTQVKKLLMDGVVGKILSVEFQWMLDIYHGADYFRRWHSDKANSGGLMVHKATHHFDLVNWWLSSVPESVFARGGRNFYNAAQAKRYGLEKHGSRCMECPVSDKCNFFLDIKSVGNLKELYLDNEKYDNYLREKCVFRDDINIEDSMNVVVQYKSGAFLSYSLNAFMPYEGYRIAFNGTKGRLEHSCQESSYINGDGRVQGGLKSEGTSIKIFPNFKTPYSVDVETVKGGHGGGDAAMLEGIFGTPKNDPLLRSADYVQGAYSILIGIAANKSMVTDKMILIKDLVEGLPSPVFPKMPGEDEELEFVPDCQRT